MNNRTQNVLLLATTLLLFSCAENGVEGTGETTTDLAASREVWQKYHSGDYSFNFLQQCFCTRYYSDSVRIYVQNDTIAAIRNLETNSFYTGEDLEWRKGGYPTIDDLFDDIQEGVDLGADSISVRYDATFGYPIGQGHIDYTFGVIDDEFGFVVSDFRFD